MTREWQGFALLAAGAIAIGAASALALSQDAAREREASTVRMRDAKVTSTLDLVRARLRNPDSAQFRNVKITSDGVVCGEVNGNNAFGALSGFSPFVMTSAGLFMLHPASEFGFATWRGHCT